MSFAETFRLGLHSVANWLGRERRTKAAGWREDSQGASLQQGLRPEKRTTLKCAEAAWLVADSSSPPGA